MEPLKGSIKFGSWLNTQNTDDMLSTNGDGSPIIRRNNYGFYGVIDQMLFREKKGQGPGAIFSQLLKIRDPETEEEDDGLWAKSYFQKVIETPEQLKNTIIYIKNNRKKHGLTPLSTKSLEKIGKTIITKK